MLSESLEELEEEMGKPGYFERKKLKKFRKSIFGNVHRHTQLSKIYWMYPFSLGDYFVFTGTRNPWDRAVSDYFFFDHQYYPDRTDIDDIRAAFKKYIMKLRHLGWDRKIGGFLTGNMRTNHLAQDYLYTFLGKTRADFVFKYETLDDDILELGKRLGLEKPLTLPKNRIKGGYRPDTRHWRDYYDDESREIIARCCRKEIELYGYSFED